MASPMLSKSSSSPQTNNIKGLDDAVTDDAASSRAGEHIFTDPSVANFWRDVYERSKYEGRHRFDPAYSWTEAEERKLVRKLDYKVLFWLWLMYCSLELVYPSMFRALTDNLTGDLGMDTNDFNQGQTIFFLCFLLVGLPSGLLNKKFGADRWLPFCIIGWSVVHASMAAMQSKSVYWACRGMTGLFMGGFVPDTVLYLTYFYKGTELPTRMSWYCTAYGTMNILGAFTGAGLLQMRGTLGWSGWRWMFLLEGLTTGCIGLASWILMTPGVAQTRNKYLRPKGWFSEHEEYILVNRLLRDDPSKGDMNNRQPVTLKELGKALADYDMWPIYFLGLIVLIAPLPPAQYFGYILRTLDFSVMQSNLLTIPCYVLNMINLLLLTYLSTRFHERALLSSLTNLWVLPFLIALILLPPPPTTSPWTTYTILTLLLSTPFPMPILLSWLSSNSNTVRTRAVSTAVFTMFWTAGGMVGSNIYREDDAPHYRRGNRVLLGLCVGSILTCGVVKGWFVWRNRAKERVWNGMGVEEREKYVRETSDEGSRRRDFRFVH